VHEKLEPMDCKQSSHILVIGAAGIDTKGHAGEPIRTGMSTPGAIRVSVDGVGRDIAENLARLGEPVVLLPAVGDDGSGRRILGQARECGIDMGHVLVATGHCTAAYLAVLDQADNLVMSIDDTGVNEDVITPGAIYKRVGLFQHACMVVLDANLKTAALRTIFKVARNYRVTVCVDPTTPNLAPRFSPFLPDLTMIAPNAVEGEAQCGVRVTDWESGLVAAQRRVSLGAQIAIVTLGVTGIVYATSRESGHVPAIECDIVDLTGACDALTAAVVFALFNGFPMDEAVRLGTSAAALTLHCRETVCPTLSLERLYDQMVI